MVNYVLGDPLLVLLRGWLLLSGMAYLIWAFNCSRADSRSSKKPLGRLAGAVAPWKGRDHTLERLWPHLGRAWSHLWQCLGPPKGPLERRKWCTTGVR